MWDSLVQQGHWHGEIWNKHKSGHIYPEWLTIYCLKDDQGITTHYLAIFDDITEKKEYEKRLVHLANYDSLTQLPNRHLLEQQANTMLSRAGDVQQSVALIFIDLNKFKNINDTLGHPMGDSVLKEVALRFLARIDEQVVLSRWGGDEFVLALPCQSDEDALQLTKRLADTLQRPFVLNGEPYHISMSAGIAMYPQHGKTVDELLRCADTAMYRAKHEGTTFYRFYDRSMNADIEHFLRIENALQHTLQQNYQGLSLAFQPQLSADGSRVLGAEVLVRWRHPDLGQVSPATFIPIAEETGQIHRLGHWIWQETIRSFVVLRQQISTPLQLSMNLSAHQLHDKGLPGLLTQACHDAGIDPAMLMLEVTETAIMSDEIKIVNNLLALKQAGFRISIDDFGTGYSCLNYIQKIRPSEIKVDQSFVGRMLSDPDSRSIIEFTYRLASSLEIEIVAEGVETEAHRQALVEIGPFVMQGYHFSKPVPLPDFISFVNRLHS